MKTRILSFVMVLGMSTISLLAQTVKTEKIEVAGNCGMCETRIEKAAKSVEGVTSADWDKESKMLEVTFDSEKSDLHKIHLAVAEVGHDTKMHKASDEVYDALPGCCKYERMSLEEHKH
jgi:mercuric ion binding protein